MKVVLLKDVRGVGKKGEIREVNDGYARNALLPKGLAQLATAGSVSSIKKLETDKAQARAARIERLKKLAKSLETLKLNFVLRAGEKGELFGSIAAKDIEQELVRYEAGEGRVQLEHPIKTLGIHRIPVEFGDGIHAIIQVEAKEKK